MKKVCFFLGLTLLLQQEVAAWGFYAHRMINYHALFLLPPEMLLFYKPEIDFITERATDPDSRRYVHPPEAARHFIDLDYYGSYPYTALPRTWKEAVARYGEDSLQAHGIVPWWIQVMLQRLTTAFKNKDGRMILKLSAELGHYIADGHVPLHACSNYNGQKTNQHGIHAFWESRIPELLAEDSWDFLLGKAKYIPDPLQYTWNFVLESAAAADTVLQTEFLLNRGFPRAEKFSFETRNGQIVKQYSRKYSLLYNERLNGMIEQRFRASIYSVASFWFTAWVNAGQPNLSALTTAPLTPAESEEIKILQQSWQLQLQGRGCE